MNKVLSTCNAAGQYLAPYVIYKFKNLYKDWINGDAPNTGLNSSKSGWMDFPQFTEWFKDKFIPQCNKYQLEKFIFWIITIPMFQWRRLI